MAVKQYIGARYVPKLDDDWVSTKEYEPLTTVNYNDNTYTSKKRVPAGTLPTNRDYWMQTGFGNQQVTSLVDWKNNIVEPFMLQTHLDIQDLHTEIDETESLGEVLTISDSYGTVTNAQGKTASALMGEYIGVNVREYALGGARFKDGTLLEGLRNFVVPDVTKIKTIIIYCGANDAWGTETAIITGITNMVEYLKSTFPNAKKIVLCGCGLTMASMNGSAPEREKVVNAYVNGAYQNGITYLLHSEAVLHNTALLQADKVHPTTTDGVLAMAKMLVAAFNGNSVSVHEKINVGMTQAADAPENFNLQTGVMIMTIDDDVVRLQAMSSLHGLLGFTSGSGVITFNSGTFYSLCNLNNTMVDGILTDANTYFNINGMAHIYGGDLIPCSMVCCIQDQVLKGMLLADYLGATIENVTGFTATDMVITLPVNRF